MNKSISEINFISSEERDKILKFNSNKRSYPKDRTFHELFEKQVESGPDRVACITDNNHFTYSQLNFEANQLAHYLRDEHHVKPQKLIGVMMDRSEWWIIAIIAVLKSGGCYVPLDPENPVERLSNIITDSDLDLLLTESNYMFKVLEFFEGKIIALDLELPTLTTSGINPVICNKSSDLAYVIYTSGSTGKPKGVLIEHQSVINLCYWHNSTFSINKFTRATLFANISFDASIWELWPYLLCGSALHPLTGEQRLDLAILDKTLRKFQITHCFLPTPILEQFEGAYPSMVIFTGGDKLKKVKKKDLTIINNYGPTESTVVVTSIQLSYENHVERNYPIGCPISNIEAYILDQSELATPVGIAGEIYVGGDGLARGYLNDPERTAENFISHPFDKSRRLYRTGDIGKWFEDGNIEYVGRKDNQIKIRGYRVELGEIEKILLDQPSVKEAVVISRTDASGNLFILGYYKAEGDILSANLLTELRKYLPAYMIPASLIKLDKFPLTLNGKIARDELPMLEASNSNAIENPRNEIESKLVEVWSEILEKDRIGITDDFFELGGHSLKATQIVSRINAELNTTIDLGLLFVYPTIKELSEHLPSKEKQSENQFLPIEEQDHYQISHAQRRLWLISQMPGGNVAYNMPFTFELEGNLNINALEKSLTDALLKHEGLRTIFVTVDMVPRQAVRHLNESLKINLVDFRSEQDKNLLAKTLVSKEAKRPFDLSTAPLLRVQLIQLEDHKYIFLLTMHHIMGDAWSVRILIQEIFKGYNFYCANEYRTLDLLSIQYKDYTAWQAKELSSGNLQKEKDYWHKQLEGTLPLLELPTDFKRPKVKKYSGKFLSENIGEDLYEQLNSIGQKNSASLFMVFIAALNVIFYRYTGQKDIILGIPVAGRQHLNLEELVGFFVNSLPIRTRFSPEDSFEILLSKVKNTMLEAYNHQTYPFDSLVDELNLPRDTSRSPVFDVMIVYQNHFDLQDEDLEINDVQVNNYPSEVAASRFDIIFYFEDFENDVLVNVEYDANIFLETSINRLVRNLFGVFYGITKNSLINIKDLDYIPKDDQLQLHAFNSSTEMADPQLTIQQLIERQVKKSPEKIAVSFCNNHLTYRKLNDESNRLANLLRKNYRVKPNDLIAIRVGRRISTVISILAVFKSGAAYVPIDLSFPLKRQLQVLKDSAAKIILTEDEEVAFEELNIDILHVNKLSRDHSQKNPTHVNAFNDFSYVMYTSGSSGSPKGVLQKHRTLSNLILWQIKNSGISGGKSLLQFNSFNFDVSIQEICFTLSTGGVLHILDSPTRSDFLEIKKYIVNNKINILSFPFSVLNALYSDSKDALYSSITDIITAGEKLSITEPLKEILGGNSVRIHNHYGPTEAHVVTNYIVDDLKELEIGSSVPIGKPISNTNIFILDENLKIVSIGVIGEIFIAGNGLANGYLNLPELTSDKFVRLPGFEGLYYRTGDLGRMLEDGNIEFLGRKDTQVKLRGYRIELGEVEHAILSMVGIKEAVVVLGVDAYSDNYLAGYYRCAPGISSHSLRSHLQGELPTY
ncbi:MAG: amino acid adenylation domain-containing protein, partial [Cytophagales bacterium]|nr:amino acid adenylation domain-containing protein [Cytophagales bacterium]